MQVLRNSFFGKKIELWIKNENNINKKNEEQNKNPFFFLLMNISSI